MSRTSWDDAEDRFARQHANCEAAWVCHGCGHEVCPRCEPSPAERELCADCYYEDGAA